MPPWVLRIRNCGLPSSRGSQPMPAFWVRPKMSPLGLSRSCSAVIGSAPCGPAPAVTTSNAVGSEVSRSSSAGEVFIGAGYAESLRPSSKAGRQCREHMICPLFVASDLSALRAVAGQSVGREADHALPAGGAGAGHDDPGGGVACDEWRDQLDQAAEII